MREHPEIPPLLRDLTDWTAFPLEIEAESAEQAIELVQERLTATLIVATKNASSHKPSKCFKFRRELLGDCFLNLNLPGAARIGRMKVNSKTVASRATFVLDPEVFGFDHL
jgi:hypothetical protein